MSQICSQDERTFLLIRFPKETVQRSQTVVGGSLKVGSLSVLRDDSLEFQDDQSKKIYSLMRNTPLAKVKEINNKKVKTQTVTDTVANEESDLFKISLQKDEAVHLGKVKLSTLLAVPKVDEKDVATVFG